MTTRRRDAWQVARLMSIPGRYPSQPSDRTACLGNRVTMKPQGLLSRRSHRLTVGGAWNQATSLRLFDEQISMAGCSVTRVATRLVVLHPRFSMEMT
jgi:hypothetical protein